MQIVISDADEANAVIAAIANLGGSLDSSMVEFVASADSELTANALTALNADLDAEMQQAASANALPDALADLASAQADVDAHDAEVAEFLADAFENEFVAAETSDQNGSASQDVEADDVIAADIADANDAAAEAFRGVSNGGAFNALSATQQDTEIALERANLNDDIEDAQDALDAVAEGLEYNVANLMDAAELALADKVAADAALVLAEDDLSGAVAAVDATLSGTGEFILVGGEYVNDRANSNINDSVLQFDNVTNTWSVAAGLALADGLYTIGNAGPTVRAVELGALLDHLNEVAEAQAAADEADDALEAAVNAAIDAQGQNNVTWTIGGISPGLVNDAIDYTPGGNPGMLDDYATALRNLDAAETALSDFDAQVEAWEATDALVDQLAGLNATGDDLAAGVIDATAAIEDAVADGGLGIDIITAGGGPVNFGGQAGDDALYVFSTADAQQHHVIEVVDFGDNGTDRIYFGEETYTFVIMAEDETIQGVNGSVSALEIFAVEDATLGNNVGGVVLYIEGIPSAGTGASDADMTRIDLIGVDLADLSYNSVTSILVAGEYVA